MARRGNELNLLVAASSDRSRFRAKIFSHALGLVFTARAFDFLSQGNFSLQLKIKFIFFLSVSQLISSLKPAGEGSHNVHVNKL
jgi:heme/copper-type cytochrome/quinol oxidase subunit 4